MAFYTLSISTIYFYPIKYIRLTNYLAANYTNSSLFSLNLFKISIE